MSISKRRGPWSSVEDRRLLHQIEQDSTLNWVNIATQVGSRTPKQCRERYHQNLKHTLSHSPITEEEGAIIKSFVERHGRRWADIARQLPGRSDNAVKNWWNGHVNRIKRHNDRQEAKAKKEAGTASASASPSAMAMTMALPPHALRDASLHDCHLDRRLDQHQRKSSLHDLVAAVSMRRPQHLQDVRDAYQSYQNRPSQPSLQLPLPSLPRPTGQHAFAGYGAPEPRREYGRPPPPPPAPASYYQHPQGCNQSCCHRPQQHPQHNQHHHQHHQHQQHAAQEHFSEYLHHPTYQSRPVSSGTSVESYSRRPSVAYAQSPGADSVDQAPSLVSDHGSPSVRGASSHAWPSPALELNALPSINGSSYKDGQTTAHSSPAAQYAYPSNNYARSARPSFSAGSDSAVEPSSKIGEKQGRVSVRDLLN